MYEAKPSLIVPCFVETLQKTCFLSTALYCGLSDASSCLCLVTGKTSPIIFFGGFWRWWQEGWSFFPIRDILMLFSLSPKPNYKQRSCSAWWFHLSAIITNFLSCKNEIILHLMHVVRIFFMYSSVCKSFALRMTKRLRLWFNKLICMLCSGFCSLWVSENECSLNNKKLEMEVVSQNLASCLPRWWLCLI